MYIKVSTVFSAQYFVLGTGSGDILSFYYFPFHNSSKTTMRRVRDIPPDVRVGTILKRANSALNDPVTSFAAMTAIARKEGVDLSRLPVNVDVARVIAHSATSGEPIQASIGLMDAKSGRNLGKPQQFQQLKPVRLNQNWLMLDANLKNGIAAGDNFLIQMKIQSGDYNAEHTAVMALSTSKKARESSVSSAFSPGQEVNMISRMYDSSAGGYNDHVKHQLPVCTLVGECISDSTNMLHGVKVFVDFKPPEKQCYQLPEIGSSVGASVGPAGNVNAIQLGAAQRRIGAHEERNKELEEFYDALSVYSGKYGDKVRQCVGSGRQDGSAESVVKSSSNVDDEKPAFWGSITFSLTASSVLALLEKSGDWKRMHDPAFVLELLSDNSDLELALRSIYENFYLSRKVDSSNTTPIQEGPTLGQLLTNTSGLPGSYSLFTEEVQKAVIDILRLNRDGSVVAALGNSQEDPSLAEEQKSNEIMFALQLQKSVRLHSAPSTVVSVGDNYLEAAILSAVCVRLAAKVTAESEYTEAALEKGIKQFGLQLDLAWNPVLSKHAERIEEYPGTSLFASADGAVSSFKDLTKFPAKFLGEPRSKIIDYMLSSRFLLNENERYFSSIGWIGEVIGDGAYTLFRKRGTTPGVGFSMVYMVPELNMWGVITCKDQSAEALMELVSAPSKILEGWAKGHIRPDESIPASASPSSPFATLQRHAPTPSSLKHNHSYPAYYSSSSRADEKLRSEELPEVWQSVLQSLGKYENLTAVCSDSLTGEQIQAKLVKKTRDPNPVYSLLNKENGMTIASMIYDPEHSSFRRILAGSGILGEDIALKKDSVSCSGNVFSAGNVIGSELEELIKEIEDEKVKKLHSDSPSSRSALVKPDSDEETDDDTILHLDEVAALDEEGFMQDYIGARGKRGVGRRSHRGPRRARRARRARRPIVRRPIIVPAPRVRPRIVVRRGRPRGFLSRLLAPRVLHDDICVDEFGREVYCSDYIY